MSAEPSFFDLVEVHRQLEAMMLHHQIALIDRDMPAARTSFESYRDLLRLHIAHEDEILMPVFERGGITRRWPPALYTGEHQKLESQLVRIEAGLDALGDEPEPAAIIDQLDLEGVIKRLHEHHDVRERENFFPVLDRVTEPAERQRLLARTRDAWFEVRDALRA